MHAITYTHARANLTATMDRVNDDHEPVIITRQKGKPVVVMSLEDFQSWEATAYLLSNPENAKKLMRSLDDAKAGRVKTVTIDELRSLAEEPPLKPVHKPKGRKPVAA